MSQFRKVCIALSLEHQQEVHLAESEVSMMQVVVVGTGYVGLVSGTCLAEMGNSVVCVDSDSRKIEALTNGVLPIYEPGLSELVASNIAESRLSFCSDLSGSLQSAEIIMVAVGTPSLVDGGADLTAVRAVIAQIARCSVGRKVIVIKSTVPVGTCEQLQLQLSRADRKDLVVVSNPEFLKQGDAVNDFLKPDRVVIGVNDPEAAQVMQDLYAPFMRTGNRLLLMDPASAEMTKYAANAFLATKISFINEISRLCERSGADVEAVRVGISSDQRIGSQFLFPGLGYGGSCFPKDVKALIAVAERLDEQVPLLRGVDQVNRVQRTRFCHKICSHYEGKLDGLTLAVWGLTFKPRTDDTREAPSLTIIDYLLESGVSLRVFDPKAMAGVKRIYGERLHFAQNYYEAAENANGLVIATEWNEFRRPDFERLKSLMEHPVIFDGRNLYSPERMRDRGFVYYSVGRT